MATALFLGAYLLSACTGAAPQSDGPVKAQKVSASEVVFTGIVEAMNGDQWTVNGQQVTVDTSTALDANIQIGDMVKVEANVSQDGSVLAVKIESSVPDDANTNSSNDNSGNANSNDNFNTNDNSNGNNNGNANDAVGVQNEVSGVVEVITSDTITIDGVVYNLAGFTEFKDGIAVGDQVKIHVIGNADGTFTISEIEKSTGIGSNDNSNSNFNGDDQIGNSNGNFNGDDHIGNSNDDDHVGNSNSNSNGDDHIDNSNSNSNDDSHSGDSNNNSSDDDHSGSNSSSGSDDHSGNSNSNDD